MIRSTYRTGLLALLAVMALGGFTASAFASGKPSAETKAASNVGGAEATLHGAVNPNGAQTKYYFEYGTTTGYGSKTPEVTLKSITAEVEVSKPVTGITTKTTYHFRLVATNSNGTTYGADEVFTTIAELPEFVLAAGGKFPVAYKGAFNDALWRTPGYEWDCSNGSVLGEITAAKLIANAKLIFQGCRTERKYCGTEGLANDEEIITEPLVGTLVYSPKNGKVAGVLFRPASGTAIAKLKCFGAKVEVTGSIIMPLTPSNVSTTSFMLQASTYSGEELRSNFSEGGEALTWAFKSTFSTSQNIEVKA